MLKLIIDTDMGNDIDDALALMLALSLEDKKECSLIGVAVNKDNQLAPAFVDILNTFYGRGDIPIGMINNGKTNEDGYFLRQIVEAQNQNGEQRYQRTHCMYPLDAVTMYRKLLAEAENNSVVISSIGFMTNLARILVSAADEFSPLTGSELVKKKVKYLMAMAGDFSKEALEKPSPEKAEFNVVNDIESAKFVCENWPTEIIFTGIEVGFEIMYPAMAIYEDFNWTENHPATEAYCLFKPMPYDRPTWDLTAILHPVRPDKNYFDLSRPGHVKIDDNGVNSFTPDNSGMHQYLILKKQNINRIQDTMRQLCRFKGIEEAVKV